MWLNLKGNDRWLVQIALKLLSHSSLCHDWAFAHGCLVASNESLTGQQHGFLNSYSASHQTSAFSWRDGKHSIFHYSCTFTRRVEFKFLVVM